MWESLCDSLRKNLLLDPMLSHLSWAHIFYSSFIAGPCSTDVLARVLSWQGRFLFWKSTCFNIYWATVQLFTFGFVRLCQQVHLRDSLPTPLPFLSWRNAETQLASHNLFRLSSFHFRFFKSLFILCFKAAQKGLLFFTTQPASFWGGEYKCSPPQPPAKWVASCKGSQMRGATLSTSCVLLLEIYIKDFTRWTKAFLLRDGLRFWLVSGYPWI